MSRRLQFDRRLAVCLAIGLAVILLTRLPHLAGGEMALDGDEAILALMAKHAIEGRGVALFFYGQSFGLALFESAAVTLFFLLFGVSGLVARWAILALWCLGWALFTLAARRLCGTRAGCVASLLLALCPAWGYWSMMPRGYHVAGFVLAQGCLWMIACLRDRTAPRPLLFAALGAGLGLLLLTQAIWLLSVLPFLLLAMRRGERQFVFLAAGCLGALGAVYAASVGAVSNYWSPGFVAEFDAVRALRELPGRVRVTLGGSYLYGTARASGFFTAATAAGWFGLALFGLWRLGEGLFHRRRRDLRDYCVIAVLLVALLTLFVNHRRFGYRYLLPVAGLLALFAGAELARLEDWMRRAGAVLLGAAMVLGIGGVASVAEMPGRHWSREPLPGALSEAGAMRVLLDDLTRAGVGHVYALHPTLQWRIIFDSRERVLARWVDPADRRPEYPRAVDEALFGGRPVAVVGRSAEREQLERFFAAGQAGRWPIRDAGGRFFWFRVDDPGVVERLGFGLNRPADRPAG